MYVCVYALCPPFSALSSTQVIFGLGVTSNSIINGSSVSLPEAAVVWGTALSVAIYATASISTGHVNPAVSVAMAVVRSKEFGPFKCLCYIISQLLGAFVAGVINFAIFNDALKAFEGKSSVSKTKTSMNLYTNVLVCMCVYYRERGYCTW